MFNLGPWEMAIVGMVAILLFGKRLPEVMKSLGKSYSEFRKGLSDIQSTVNYNDYTSTTSSHSSSKSYTNDDYDEPTAPKFEPPPADEPVSSEQVSSLPSESIEKPIGEKSI